MLNKTTFYGIILSAVLLTGTIGYGQAVFADKDDDEDDDRDDKHDDKKNDKTLEEICKKQEGKHNFKGLFCEALFEIKKIFNALDEKVTANMMAISDLDEKVENISVGEVDWADVQNKPPGFEDNIDDDTLYSGANFTLSNQGCNTGDFVTGINSDGIISCLPDQIGETPTLYSKNLIEGEGVLTIQCDSGDMATGGGAEWINGRMESSFPVNSLGQPPATNEMPTGWRSVGDSVAALGNGYVICMALIP